MSLKMAVYIVNLTCTSEGKKHISLWIAIDTMVYIQWNHKSD